MYELAIFMLLILSAQALFSFFRIVTFTRVSENVIANIRKKLYEKLLKMPMNFFHQQRVGELNSRLTADLSLISDTFILTLPEFLRGIINLIIGITIIFWISTRLTLVMLASFPIMIVGAILFGRFIKKLSKQVQDELAKTSTIAQETFLGILNVKTFTNEDYEQKRYSNSVNKTVQLALRASWFRAAFASFIIFCLFGAIILIVAYGAYLVQNQEITVGNLTQFVIYTVFVGAALGGFSEYYAQIQKTLGATQRVRELFSESTESIDNQEETFNFKGQIDFHEVHFAYPTRVEHKVLKGVSFQMNAGEVTALVGASGAGKSTIAQLLMRLYEPTQGQILLDGIPIQKIPLKILRKQIAIVPQDVLLFGGTIYENILYGNLSASREQVIQAAQLANAHDFIVNFPEGYETIVGERGVKLSGGQRQRIAIARALLKNPKILILDEATSSLDSESEHLVQEALNVLMEGRTTLVIAHRLSTVKKAHQILVLQDGIIIEKGTHDELIQNSQSAYFKFAELQFQF
jgi:ABC-type multidrug transport system fused ATPase/permease subunit